MTHYFTCSFFFLVKEIMDVYRNSFPRTYGESRIQPVKRLRNLWIFLLSRFAYMRRILIVIKAKTTVCRGRVFDAWHDIVEIYRTLCWLSRLKFSRVYSVVQANSDVEPTSTTTPFKRLLKTHHILVLFHIVWYSLSKQNQYPRSAFRCDS